VMLHSMLTDIGISTYCVGLLALLMMMRQRAVSKNEMKLPLHIIHDILIMKSTVIVLPHCSSA
jgi:hypothetical protein